MKILKSEIDDKEIYKQSKYRSMVGKVMYLVSKSDPTCLNAVRGLAQHFTNPTKQQWRALMKLIGHIKSNIGKGRILQEPKEFRFVTSTDPNYANDEDNRESIMGVLHLSCSMCVTGFKIQLSK